MDWIDVNDRMPEKIGLYHVLNPNILGGEFRCFYVRKANGYKTWVCNNPDEITHWKPIDETEK